MIKVYQIQLTDQEVDLINSDGEYTPRIKAFFSRMVPTQFKAENFQYYNHVANVDTNDMDDAFRLMNLWDYPELVERFGPCSSMSVGDIIEMADGSKFRVDSFGFERI